MKVLVIGGASGLGEAVADQALHRGDAVTVLDFDAERLEKFSARARTGQCDIADGSSVERALDSVAESGPFDLVVFTAGISAVGRFEELDPIIMARVVGINLTGTMVTTAAILERDMIAPSGRLVFTSSLSYFVGYPGASAYAASKDGLVAFARSIRRELRRRHAIVVQVVTPGPMDTAHAERYAPPGSRRDRRTSPKKVAATILRATRNGLIIPGAAARLAATVGWLAPVWTGRIMRRVIYDRLE